MQDDYGWTEVGGATTFIRWENAKVIEGIYQGSREVPGGLYGPSRRYLVTMKDGARAEFPAPAMLRRKLDEVLIGHEVRIEFTGRSLPSNGKGPIKEFLVSHRPARESAQA